MRDEFPLPTLFIGSSTEGLAIARNVQAHLDDVAEVTLWRDGPFRPSETYMGSLREALRRFDFALLVLTADDLLRRRDEELRVPRDNVLFELGLFLGHLGNERTFAAAPRTDPPHLPSDLDGVSIFRWSWRPDGNLRAAVAKFCTDLGEIIRRDGKRRPPVAPLVGIWRARIDWTNEWAERLINYEAAERLPLAQPHSIGEVHVYTLRDGEYRAFSIWTLRNGTQELSRLVVTPESFELDAAGKPSRIRLQTAFRKRLEDFSYAPFAAYVIEIEHVAERSLSGHVVVDDGESERVAGRIEMHSSH